MSEKRNSRIMRYLIAQCKNPTGFIGNTMINIWNKTFPKMALWGLSHVYIDKADTILEIGFGGGVIINYLAKKRYAKKIYGIDISKISVQKAKELNKEFIKTNKVTLLQGTVENLPFPEAMFNKVFAIQTHIYWNEFEQSIKKIFDSLNINGEFNIICEKDKIFYHLPKYLKKESMIKLLKQYGFNTTHVFETQHWIQYQSLKEYN